MIRKSRSFKFGSTNTAKLIIMGSGLILFFVIVVIIILSLYKNLKLSPTGVEVIKNYNTRTITTDLMSGGWGSKDAKELDPDDNLSYIIGNNGGDDNNPNTAVLNIKYPVTKDIVYQVTIELDTNPDNHDGLVSKGDVFLPQWDGKFVLDDLKKPANKDYITIPSNSFSKYTYNTKWWRPTGSYFTIVFKFATKEDSIIVRGLTITPLN